MRWVLLGVAAMLLVIFIVVILPGTGGKQPNIAAATVQIKSNPETLHLSGEVGSEIRGTIEIQAAHEIAIFDAQLETADPNLRMNNTCVSLQRISKDIPCQVNLTWTPGGAVQNQAARVLIKYGAVGTPADAAQTFYVPVTLNANGIALPAVAQAPAFIDEETAVAPPPTAPSGFMEDDFFEPAPMPVDQVPAPVFAPEPRSALTFDDSIIPDDEDACYRFAFVGYNLTGQRAGWIRPQGGRYLFHPFSDVNCINPIGEYNIDTGFIFDIKDPNRKIGSDAERLSSGPVTRSQMAVPSLGGGQSQRGGGTRARQLSEAELMQRGNGSAGNAAGGARILYTKAAERSEFRPSSMDGNDAIVSSQRPYNRKFVLRQFKPIPATIVNDVRADERVNELPIRAVVDRNVFSDSERTIIVPAGTLLLGYVTGVLPGPYKTIGRIQVCWYQMIRPDGVEFHLGGSPEGCDVYAADSQGRIGVPGRGSTDYLEEMIIPMAAALVPAAVNLIAPISDRFINQIDLNNNTVTQSGTMRSSELAKQEVIKSWDKVTQRLFIDMMDNMTPPFTIPAGTRITVLSRKDIVVNWDQKQAPSAYTARPRGMQRLQVGETREEIIGQVRATRVNPVTGQIEWDDQDRNPLLRSFLEQSQLYESQFQAQRRAFEQQQHTLAAQNNLDECGNNRFLNLRYVPGTCTIISPSSSGPSLPPAVSNIEDSIFQGAPAPSFAGPPMVGELVCDDGSPTDQFGCCPSAGEQFVNEQGGICCLISDPEQCFPPLM